MTRSREDELLVLLRTLPPGPVGNRHVAGVMGQLAACWDDLRGARETSMAAYKLGRAEQIEWRPPCLAFRIERHGARANGSKYAEVQSWTINLDTREASCTDVGRRLLEPLSRRLDVRPLATEVVDALRAGAEHRALVWSADRNGARLRIGEVIPDDGATNNLTMAGRRKRLRAELETQARAQGWEMVLRGIVTSFRRLRETE